MGPGQQAGGDLQGELPMAPQQPCPQVADTARGGALCLVGITWLASSLILFGRFYSCSHFTDEDSKASRGCLSSQSHPPSD